MTTKTASRPSLLDVLRGARSDVREFIDRRIDAAEKRTRTNAKSLFRFARSLTKRLGGAAKRTR